MTDYPQLFEALQRRTLALFIGADLPREITGLPSRAELARDLARRHNLDSALSLAEVAQRVSQAGNRFEFTDFIRNQLDTSKPPQPFHQNIVALVKEHRIETIVTTACDNLLEIMFQQAGIGLNRIVRGSDVSFIAPDRPTLIYLYGKAEQPDTLVVTNRDHSDLLRDRDKEALVDEVRQVFRRKTMYFIGYNLGDPDFRFLFDQIAESKFARTAYAVWPGLPEADVRMWRDRGIVILDTDPLGIVGQAAAQPVPPSRPDETVGAPAAAPAAERETLSKALDMARRALAILEEQVAGFGSLNVPVHLRIELEDKRREVTELEARLSGAGAMPSTKSTAGAASGGPAPVYGTGKRWAVLVGVNEYEDAANYGRLKVCVKDVQATREQLLAGGLDAARTRLLTDNSPERPTRGGILAALKSVAEATELDDVLLFYYSGHGDEAGGESYLVARDGRRVVLSDTAVPLARVKQIMEGAPARAKIILLDACHSGADIGGKGAEPMTEAFIRRVFEEAEGLAILASCKQGQLSYEWRESERSVFTHYLLEALAGSADRDGKGFVTVQDASRHVTDGVKLWAAQRNISQTPTLQYTVAGDIILVRYQ